MQQHKLLIYCPITMKKEFIYIYTLDYEDIHLKRFNGCENTHGCTECQACEAKAWKLFQQLSSN